MRGFIRRRGAAWELRVYLGQDTVTGKKRYATKSVRGSRREADRCWPGWSPKPTRERSPGPRHGR